MNIDGHASDALLLSKARRRMICRLPDDAQYVFAGVRDGGWLRSIGLLDVEGNKTEWLWLGRYLRIRCLNADNCPFMATVEIENLTLQMMGEQTEQQLFEQGFMAHTVGGKSRLERCIDIFRGQAADWDGDPNTRIISIGFHLLEGGERT